MQKCWLLIPLLVLLILSNLSGENSGKAMTQEIKKSFTFKAIELADFPLLYSWFKQDYIAALWVEPQDWQDFQDKWKARLFSTTTHRFMGCIDQKPIAFIQYSYVDDEDRKLFPDITIPEHSVSMDLLIGDPAYLGKGYGTQLLQDFISFVQTREPDCTTIIIDPATDNHRAIACYQKVGFKTVGTYITPWGPTGECPGPILLMIKKI